MIYTLDLETRPLDPSMANHAALEPWRARQGKAEISSIAICRPSGETIQLINNGQPTWIHELIEFLRELDGKPVYAHNALFDVAWLIATIQKVRGGRVPDVVSRIKWRDTMLLTKWLINGQKAEEIKFSYSLVNLVKTFLPEHPATPEFVLMKEQKVDPGMDSEYWEKRGVLDVILTQALAAKLQPKLPEEQRVGFMTECACIVPVANAWVTGIRVDAGRIDEVEAEMLKIMNKVIGLLGVQGSVISSPKQLGNLLFNDWGIRPWSRTKTGPSTSKTDLMWIQWSLQTQAPHYSGRPDLVEKMGLVMEYKKNATLISKYIKTLREALEHTGDGYIYGVPKLFGTYTGRMTYSNSTFRDGPKVSIALHQIPRKAKEVRSLLLPPEGMGLIEDDASGQESRLMAIRSGDEMMLKVFADDLNFHGMTGSAIIGMDYYDFMEEYKKQDEGYYVEQRQLGKLTNLSCNYRIGGKALAEKALVTYDTFMTEEMGRFLVNTFKRQYPGVPMYWDEVCKTARALGYTEVFGGRRYKIHRWDTDRWMSESSAINTPIQGAGASMKEIAIANLFKKFPEAPFALDLHDATFSYCDERYRKELEKEILDFLNNIDYEPYWGFKPPIPLSYEGVSGTSFKDVK